MFLDYCLLFAVRSLVCGLLFDLCVFPRLLVCLFVCVFVRSFVCLLFVVCSLLFVVCCLLCVVCCLMCDVRSSLFAVCC